MCLSITSAWCSSMLQSTLACAWTGCWTSSNTLKMWQERLHPESHSSVVLLVQPGEPLPKHYGSPHKPWYSLQLNTVPLSGAEAHTWRRLTSQWTALYGPYLVVSSRHLFSSPCLSRDSPAGIRRKAATLTFARKAVNHYRHILHDTTKNEVPPCRLKSRKPYNKEAQEMLSVIPEDRSKDAWIVATWKQEWEASGPTRVLPHSKCESTRNRVLFRPIVV